MKKVLTKVLSLLMVALIAAPAATAGKHEAPLPLTHEVDKRQQESGILMPMTKNNSFKNNANLKSGVSADNLRSVMNRKNAKKFSPAFAATQPTFNAVLVFDDTDYSFPVSSVQMTKFSAQPPCTSQTLSTWSLKYGATMGAVMGKDYYYVTDAYTYERYGSLYYYYDSGKVYDPATWELVDEVPITDHSAFLIAAAYDPTTGNIYAFGEDAPGEYYQFGIFNPDSFTTSFVADATIYCSAMAFTGEGVLYAIDSDGNFGTINKSNGRFSLIKSTGIASKFGTSGAIDPLDTTPVFYYAACNDDGSELYAIDCATGDVSLVYTFNNGQEIKGMYFNLPKTEEEKNAPGRPTINSVEFEGTSLSGSITFTAPAKLAGGGDAPAGQALTYEVVANGKVIRSGSGIEYGHSYKVNIDVDAPAMYTFSVFVYNDVAPSVKSNNITRWVGADIPNAVAKLDASWAEGKMTLNWDAVTTGANGGEVENVTYAIYDAADSTLVKEAITETSYTFELKEPATLTAFQYYIIAVSNGEESESTLSNKVMLGNVEAPFTTAINSSATPSWTIYDLNGDGSTWSMNSSEAQYSYNYNNKANDWLITNGIAVKKGMLYTITISARCNGSNYPEKLDLMLGTDATPQSMTTTLISTTIANSSYTDYSTTFTPQSDVIYIGFHAVSEKNMWNLYVNKLSIEGGVNANAPAAPTDLGVIVPFSGENKATLSYTAPELTIMGTSLTGSYALTSVEVLVNDEIEFVDNKPTAGAKSSIEIDVPEFGVYNFKVIAYNSYGDGEVAEVSAYVGINKPAAVANAMITEVADGVINITWDAVTTDIDGNLMNPALVKYTVAAPVYDQYGNIADLDFLAEGITDTFVKNIQAMPAGEQDFVQYIVFSETEAGESYNWTNMMPVGTPYSLPYADTFENGRLEHNFGIGSGDSWMVLNRSAGFDSRNSDNGYLGCYGMKIMGSYYGGVGHGSIYTGKIALTDKNPELNFYYLCINPECRNSVITKVICDGDTTDVDEAVCVGDFEWKLRTVDLSKYAGKTVQILFYEKMYSSVIDLPYLTDRCFIGMLDDIRIGEPLKIDLVANEITVPSAIRTESEFNIGYSVTNQGSQEAKNVYVSLYANGNLVESSVDTLTVAAGDTIMGTFNQAAYSLFEDGTYEFSYVVDCEGDQDPTNNTSDLVKVTVFNTNFPTLELAGIEDINKADSVATVNLTWTSPTIDLTYGVEGFESDSYPVWTTTSFGGWTLLNFNENGTYGNVSDTPFPNMFSAFGWILFDAAEQGVNEPGNPFAAYEGSCYMAAFAHNYGANDAWLISPAQSGAAQTVTFMARNAGSTYYNAETMRCYYSTTGTAVEDFEMLMIQGYNLAEGVPYAWTEYSIDLPAGTKYFAIRSTANNTYCLMVDNITYMGGTSPFENLELAGYEVYRDQVKLTDKPISVEEYTDVVKKNGTYAYSVVAVYNEGKSAPSNVYTVDVDFTQEGIADAAAGVKVAVEGREIVVTGAEAVAISAVDGKLVYAGESARVAVAPGVYVVKADAAVAKVIVK